MTADDHALSDLERAVHDQLNGWGLLGTAEGQAAVHTAHLLAHAEDLRPAAAAELLAQLRAQLVDLRKLAPPADELDGVAELQDAYQGLKAVQ